MGENDNIQLSSGWEVTRLIGTGSFGAVYEIRRDLFGNVERAALKVLHIPRSPGEIDEMFSDGYDRASITERLETDRENLVREYALMADIKGHANIVYCDDIKQIPHQDGLGWDIYIRMELLTPLVQVLNQGIPEGQVLDIGVDMCSALIACRQKNIVHRDIKPQNIFVSRDGLYKLGDFGVAKTAVHTVTGTKTGTYRYMAPEVFNNRPYGTSADLYSLGLVLYWLLNERRIPFSPLPPQVPTATQEEEAKARRFQGEPLPPPAHGSPALQAIVLKACAYDPKDRFSGPEEMLQALQALQAGRRTPVVFPRPASEPVGSAAQLDETEHLEIPNARSKGGTMRVHPVIPPAPEEDSRKPKRDVPNPSAERKTSSGPRGRIAALWAAAAAGLLLICAGVALLVFGGKGGARSAGESETAAAGPTDEAGLPLQLNWSDWTEALPDYVTLEHYYIAERKMHSTRTMETTESDQDKLEGWELYKTSEGKGEWGSWSKWSQKMPKESDKREIQKQTRYRTSEKQTTTAATPTLEGWTPEGSQDSYGSFGAWSDWSSTPIPETDGLQVETRSRFRYRDRETTTASTETLSGWTRYDSSSEESADSWSDWQTDSISSGPSREVETKTQYRYRSVDHSYSYTDWSDWSDWQDDYVSSDALTDVETQTDTVSNYLMGHYCLTEADSDSPLLNTYPYDPESDADTEYHLLGWFDQLDSFTLLGEQDGYDGYSCSDFSAGDCPNGQNCWYILEKKTDSTTRYRFRTREETDEVSYGSWSAWSDTAYSDSSTREVETRTLYRSRSLHDVTTYYFYRWGDWSDWSDRPAEETENREVETETSYRSRTRSKIRVYQFSRWGAWSDWSDTPASETDTLRVETSVFYRHRDQLEKTTYFFRRWGEWSAYEDGLGQEAENTELRHKVLYQYRSRGREAEAEVLPDTPRVTAFNNPETGKISLVWDPIPGVRRYLVYRSSGRDDTYGLMRIVDYPGYTNLNCEPGREYSYVVCTVGDDSVTGPFCAPVFAVCMLPRPQVKGSHSAAGKNRLTWKSVDGAAVYEVYRSDSKNGSYSLMKTTDQLTYTNVKAEEGATYYYKVRAVSADGTASSAYSEILSLTAK